MCRSAPGRAARFSQRLSQPHLLLGAATLSLSYIPLMSWVAVSPVILMDAGGLTTSEFAWSQVPVFSAVIIANLSVARWVKDPTRPRFVLSAVPVQMLGLAILIVGNLVWHHVWLWSVLGTCFYAFGIGLIFPTLFRFYPLFQRPAERHGLRLAEYRDPQRQRVIN